MNKKYRKLNEEFRDELEKSLQLAVVEQFRQDAVKEGFYKYEVQLQDLRFITYMSNKELEQSIKLTIDLLEEAFLRTMGLRSQIVTSNQTESINRIQGQFLKDMLKFYANFRITIEIPLKRNYTIPTENTNIKK